MGNFPLVPYRDTRWLGLPGGKITIEEAVNGVNFLSAGAYPTLIREVKEECGIDITQQLLIWLHTKPQDCCITSSEINQFISIS